MRASKPWLRFYGDVPQSIDYPQVTLYDVVADTVGKYPDDPAYDFMGFTSTYRRFLDEIDRCADALAGLGLAKGDRVTIAMPTTPQGIICFYAANKLGAVASMIHPLSTASEIEFYLNLSRSKLALTLNAFYGKFKEVMARTGLQRLILAEIPDYLPWLKGIAFQVLKGRKIPKVPPDDRVVWWRDLMKMTAPEAPKAVMNTHDLAVILYSGGTTGKPKGIMLSNANFIAEGMQCAHW
ncbi:MAG: AMP-binding protein, partial [Desulfobacterales bacterium]|nr:AMP-binding protein [Desulfobacterales bacterium]